MKHQHHRGASTCSPHPITDTTKDYYLPLHRSITDDHEDKHAKHHTRKSPITRFVCKLLGLESSASYKSTRFEHKSDSTTSITKSSVFHFPSSPSSPPYEEEQSGSMLSYFHHTKKKMAKKKTSKLGNTNNNSNNCNSNDNDAVNNHASNTSTSSASSILSLSSSNDQSINHPCQYDKNNPATESTSSCTSASTLTHEKDNNLNEKNDQFSAASVIAATAASSKPLITATQLLKGGSNMMVTPAMDALFMASQIPSVKKIHFVDEFDIPPPALTQRDPNTHPLLTGLLAEQLRPYLPRRYRLASEWSLLYSLDQHGASLSTLYSSVKDTGPCIIVIKDDEEQIFGAFLNESIRLDLSYYGTGECFLWKLSLPVNAAAAVPLSQHASNHHHPTPKIKVYPWTGRNEYMIYSTIDCIAIGGGDGKFGLWLNQDLERGHSEPCATFDNECLSLNSHFSCIDLEIWSFRM